VSTGLLVFSNVVAPLVTGLFFVLCFTYFVVASPSKAPSFRHFVVFLISFGLFSFGRPLQLLLGAHPIPLIVVNIRVFILCAVIAPAILRAADVFSNQQSTRASRLIVLPCILLGLTYGVFNTLGTHDSYVLFEIGTFIAYDNLTPSHLAPFFGREVTIGVQCVTGMLLLLISSRRLASLIPHRGGRHLLRDKNFLINLGIVLFSTSFIIGSLAKQWWIYYAASIVTALLFGAAVLLDAKEVHRYYEKLIPFIKEDIIHNVAFSEFSRSKLTQMLDCLGKEVDLDTVVVMRIRGNTGESEADFAAVDDVVEGARRALDRLVDSAHFLLIPLSGARVGIVFHSPSEWQDNKKERILEVLEEVKEAVNDSLSRSLSIGVGRCCDRIENLGISYHEAMSAQEYADQFEGSTVIHVDDVNERDQRATRYPVKEKERLLSAIRLGDVEASTNALGEFVAVLRPFMEERPEQLRVRLYELIGSLVDSAVLGGGDEESLDRLADKYVGDVALMKEFSTAEQWLGQVVLEIAGGVVFLRTRRIGSLISRAVAYISANYASPLSYKDVAREVGISPSYFMNLFKKETGATFVDYLTAVRIDAAKEMLVTSDLNITQIAFDVGFNSSNYFSSTFRKVVGVPAKEYRAGRPRSGRVLGPVATRPLREPL
jgi:two-component system, response regulator YesN